MNGVLIIDKSAGLTSHDVVHRARRILGQRSVGHLGTLDPMATGVLPGGGAPARLPRLVGRARAIEIIAGAEDFDGELAERYGYVNRAVADDEFETFVHTFATRVSGFDRQAIEELKSFVDPLTLPSDDEFPPQTEKVRAAVGRPEVRGRIGRLFEHGLQKPGPVEEKLGTFAARA